MAYKPLNLKVSYPGPDQIQMCPKADNDTDGLPPSSPRPKDRVEQLLGPCSWSMSEDAGTSVRGGQKELIDRLGSLDEPHDARSMKFVPDSM